MSRMESVTQTNKSDQKHAKLIWTFGIEHRDPGENVPLWRAKWKSELFSQLLTMPKTSLCLHVLRNVTVDPDPIIKSNRNTVLTLQSLPVRVGSCCCCCCPNEYISGFNFSRESAQIPSLRILRSVLPCRLHMGSRALLRQLSLDIRKKHSIGMWTWKRKQTN